jgi:hypothetical protein
MQPPRLQFVHGLIRKEARSLLQFIAESSPWAAADRQDALQTILHMAKHEAHQIEQMIRMSIKTKLGNPSLGAYPQSFMSINFMSLEFLAPLLIDDHKKRIADLEWSQLSAPVEFQGLIRDLTSAKIKHLEKMKTLVAPLPAAG